MNLYGRVVELRVVNAHTGAQIADVATFSNSDMDFSVTRDPTTQQNDLALSIYNLSDRARSMFQQPLAGVELRAGYKDAVATIFSGRIRYAQTMRESADLVTRVEAGEGADIFNIAVKYAFGNGTAVRKVGETIIAAFAAIGITKGNFDTTLGAATSAFPKGTSYTGNAMQRLRSLARDHGDWLVSVQFNQLLFYRSGSPVDNRVIVLSPATGLVGTPETGEKKVDKTKKVFVKAKALLQPQLKVGSLVSLDSEFKKGLHVVHELKHSGSNYQTAFYTDLELLPR